MSYILEALRKAERERALGRAPDLNGAVPIPARRSIWPWMTGLVIAANTVALIWVLDQRWHTSPDGALKPSPLTVQPEPLAIPIPARQAVPTAAPKIPSTPKQPAPARTHETPSTAPVTSIPLLQSLPAEFRRTLSELNLDVHVFNQNPTKRFVLINSRRYREGDSLQEGPVLETITLNGAVFSHRGQRFRILLHD